MGPRATPRGLATSLQGGRRRAVRRRTSAVGLGWGCLPRAGEDRGAPRRPDSADRGREEGDRERETHGDQRRREEDQIREAEERGEGDDGMGRDDPQRTAEDRTRKREDEGLGLVDPGDGRGGRAQAAEDRDLPRASMDLEAHRRVHDQADDDRDDEGENPERGLDLGDAAPDESDGTERPEPRAPEGRGEGGAKRAIPQDRLHGPTLSGTHRDEQVRPYVGPVVRKQFRPVGRGGDDRKGSGGSPEHTQVPRGPNGDAARRGDAGA